MIDSSDAEEISAFAERVLRSPSLEDKLRTPESLSDHSPRVGSKSSLTELPAREDHLKLLGSGTTRREKALLRPNLERLELAEFRGRVLHTFAHHELISLELMALALLKFPEAPRAFRRGLAQVMRDEQHHCRLYLERLDELDVPFGSEAVSDYFWRSVAHSTTPHAFNTRLALVFEQANIDFTEHYAPLFRAVGDEKSALALDEIYQDEISHVGFGLHWFRRWRPQNQPEWDSFCELLTAPLSPGRARGVIFSISGRREAGFSDEFIEHLRLWGGSTGRPPVVWIGNFDVEDEILDEVSALLGASGAQLSSTSPRARTKRRKTREASRRCLTPLLAWVITRGDIVYCPDGIPSQRFQHQLQKTLGYNPEWISSLSVLKDRKLGGFSPWGWSETVEATIQDLYPQLTERGQTQCLHGNSGDLRPVYSKQEAFAFRQLVGKKLVELGEVCPCYRFEESDMHWIDSREGLEVFFSMAEESEVEEWVFKSAWSNAGRGHLKFRAQERLDPPSLGWIERRLKSGFAAEPWLKKYADLSFHGEVRGGAVQYLGEVLGIVNDRGRFEGAYLAPPSAVLPSRGKRFLNGDGQDRRRLSRIGKVIISEVGLALAEYGYQGPFGVDGMLIENEAGNLELVPVIEVNPRLTMGRVALQIRNRLSGEHIRHSVMRCGVITKELSDRLEENPPQWNSQGQWVGGMLCLTDLWSEIANTTAQEQGSMVSVWLELAPEPYISQRS